VFILVTSRIAVLTQLIDEEVKLVETYYNMLALTSNIQESVLAQTPQDCDAIVSQIKTKKYVSKEDELVDLQSVVDEPKTMVEEAMPTNVETRAIDYASQYGDLVKALEGEFSQEIADGTIVFNQDTMGIRIAIPEASMPLDNKGNIVMSDAYKAQLDNFIPRYVNVLKSYKDSIEKVNVDGFSSTNFVAAKNDTENFMANLKVSKARANKVLSYIKSIDDSILKSNKDILNKFKAYGRSYANPVLNADGTENIEMSKRVEFIVKGK
jgi:outer membrane protein OmpA-like peptidoglycan-associated protein